MKKITLIGLVFALAALSQNGRPMPCITTKGNHPFVAGLTEQMGTASVGSICQPENGVWSVRDSDGKITAIRYCEDSTIKELNNSK